MADAATILVVDDNPTNLAFLSEALATAGYNVRVAAGGADALASVTLVAPDLILLDIQMPAPDGREVCRRLKADPATAAVPIIFVTALTGELDEVEGLQLGAADYVTKPIRIEVVLARVATHLQIARLQRELIERNAMLDSYAAMTAHDLKNPLSAILTTVQLLVSMPAAEQAQHAATYLPVVDAAARRAINMVHDLLTHARTIPAEIVREPITMGPLVEGVIDQLVLPLLAYRGTIVTPDEWPPVRGTPRIIELVWINLISNALKYGGLAPRIEIGARTQRDGMVCCWVRDYGPGLAPEQLEGIFGERQRRHVGRGEGHGLGLAGVKRLVERMGGSVGVESTPGAGSTFFFMLPGPEQ